jgi:hypothetical protein
LSFFKIAGDEILRLFKDIKELTDAVIPLQKH